MPEAAIWTALAAVGAFGLAILRWVSGNSTRLANVEARATAADNISLRAIGKVELLATELSNHRVDIAGAIGRLQTKTDALGESLFMTEKRITTSIDLVSQRVGDMNSRIDHLLGKHTISGR